MFFEITHQEKKTKARIGIIHTEHGDIETPIFMPVGTQATVKTLDTQDLQNLNAQIILGNTYHLHLRPGEDQISQFGGLHKFMSWPKPILTDSGGFQVFSLGLQKTRKQNKEEKTEMEISNGKLVEIDEEGVTFRSHLDGSKHRFTPESAIEIQHKIGADIIMAFDECTPDGADYEYTKQAMERTHRWAQRCLKKHQEMEKQKKESDYKQFLFGIIQGANHKELREESAKYIASLDFDGIAIGGESIGYNMEATKEILDWLYPIIPQEKPHYTMGLGFSPLDLFEVIERGVDMFDCVAPTRQARNGSLYISPAGKNKGKKGKFDANNLRININNAQFISDPLPIDPYCNCFTCQNHSRAYLHHLFKCEELLAYRLSTIHNVHFFINLTKEIRKAIQNDQLLKLKTQWFEK